MAQLQQMMAGMGGGGAGAGLGGPGGAGGLGLEAPSLCASAAPFCPPGGHDPAPFGNLT